MKLFNSKRKTLLISALIIVLIALLGVAYAVYGKSSKEYIFVTEVVKKSSVYNTITATGTLEATNTVVVGTQVSGVIEKIYVDFNSIVKKGQLIAELDKYTLQSSLETAQADLDKAQADYEYQTANLERIKVIFEKDFLAQSDYDLAVYNYKNSKAMVKSANANLDRAARNLSYATIYSPIDGIVINRAVEEGQTVASSMNTPELFTITNMLSVMQVEADIDEADIGMVKQGQRVEFTVDAFPDEVFTGSVSEVRLQPVEVSNVITYTVIVSATNPNLMLKPGMTAGITVFVEEVNDIMTITGKAIRFSPEREFIMSYMESLPEEDRPSNNRPPRPDNANAKQGQDGRPPRMEEQEMDENTKQLWIKKGNDIRPAIVKLGINDGTNYQIISGLNIGDTLISSMELGEAVKVETKKETKSPFVQESQGRRGPGGPR